MTDEWGPWIEHDGKGCPVIGQIMEARWRAWNGVLESANYLGEERSVALGGASWTWRIEDGIPVCYDGNAAPIIRYRIRKPLGLQILEDLIADAPNLIVNGDFSNGDEGWT